MSIGSNHLDLTPHPRRDIADKVLSVSTALFDSVKLAPLPLRSGLPSILRNNNFALAVRVTRRYAFLEVTSKFRAQKSRENDRLTTYRQFFTPKESGKPAIFAFDKARLCRVSNVTADGAPAFSIGRDVSMCVWDVRNSQVVGDKRVTTDIDLLYVVSFGDQLHDDESWQEIDALIRITLADWSSRG